MANGATCRSHLTMARHGRVLATKPHAGTGFTTRLDGTGSAFGASDSQLELDQAAGVLRMESTNSNLNGQANLANGVYPGIRLSSLGFTGSEDFCVSAKFTDVRYERIFDQFGVYVGGSSSTAVRAGYLSWPTGGTVFNVWTLGGLDQGLALGSGPAIGADMDVVIQRTGGAFSMLVGGFDLSTSLGTASLNALDDLTVGIFAANAENPFPQLGTLTEFFVGVDAASVPEPSSAWLVLLGLTAAAAARRQRPRERSR